MSERRLVLRVLEGRNLAVKDLNGYSDPYCIIRVRGAKAGNKIRTKTIPKNLFPVWNEKYDFEITDPNGEIFIEMWDEDFLTPDDFMGQLKIPFSSIPIGQTYDKWFPLEKRKQKEKISGDIHLIINYSGSKKAMAPDDFQIVALIGKGTFGKVFQVRKKDNSKIYAMKVLRKAYIIKQQEVEHTLAERSILKSVKHPFMVNMRFSFQTDTKLYIVLDYVNGGEMFYHLQRARRFDEPRACFYAAEVVLAIEFLHSRGIIYRDLKPENVLIEDTGHVRITDFGLSKEGLIDTQDRTTTFCGTPAYLAPEVVQQKAYGKEIDWWSLGNLIYEMMTGLPPFYDPAMPNVQNMYRRILAGDFTFPSYISPTAQSIMKALLTVDPKVRLGYNDDANAIKAHTFFKAIDWVALLKKTAVPPFIPKVQGAADLSQFDKTFTSEVAVDNDPAGHVSPADQAKFHNFEHVDESELPPKPEPAPAPALAPTAPTPTPTSASAKAAPVPPLGSLSSGTSSSPSERESRSFRDILSPKKDKSPRVSQDRNSPRDKKGHRKTASESRVRTSHK